MARSSKEDDEWRETSDRVRYYLFRNKLKEKAGGNAPQSGFVDEAALSVVRMNGTAEAFF